MTAKNNTTAAWKLAVMVIFGVLIIIAMSLLGVWQLGRADEKQRILDESRSRSNQAAVAINDLDPAANDLRFSKVRLTGTFLPDKTIFVDRQVVRGQVGYQVFTPLRIAGTEKYALIARGWVSVGESREKLPSIDTQLGVVSLLGRLNHPPAKPPLWSDDTPVADGAVWQYLPIAKYAQQMRLNLFPLVVELAPETPAPAALLIDWPEIDDHWVAKHQGYAFQWFAMALAFFIACIFLLIRRASGPNKPHPQQ